VYLNLNLNISLDIISIPISLLHHTLTAPPHYHHFKPLS
jgi:hypothetical protein